VHSREQSVDAQILDVSNDIWIRDDLPPEASYLDTLAKFYGAGVHHADFPNQPEQVRLAINDKVSTDTHDLIPELIPRDSITSDTVNVLTNALYFKAPWQKAMAAPVPGDFHKLDGSTLSAGMLKTSGMFQYYAGSGFVSVAVPYYGQDLELLLIVPDAGAYESVRSALSAELLDQMLEGRTPTSVELTLAKFEVKSDVPATRTLKALGMSAPFDASIAEFPKLVSETYPVVSISAVIHQATVAIDEKGTEASAATAIVLVGSSAGPVEPPPPIVVTVDRPFLFAIRDNPTGAVLFVGQVVAP
jgi:serpin B